MPHPLYPNSRGDCYACSLAVTAPGQVRCAAHGTGYIKEVRTDRVITAPNKAQPLTTGQVNPATR